MKLKSRIKRIEGIMQPDDPIQEARELANFCIETGLCGKEEVSRLTAEFAQAGLSMKDLLDSIAANGRIQPKGAPH